MLSKKVADLLNNQINEEFYSAYLYMQFYNYFVEQGLDGYANWYNIQCKEEMDHGMLMVQYLHNNDYEVTLEAIKKPDAKIENFQDALEQGLAHERYITDCIHKIYEAATDDKDYRTLKFLDWFVDEQGEEEKNATDMITKYKLFGGDPKGLYALDSEYKARAYNTPSLVLD